MLIEEAFQFVERDQIYAIVQIDVSSTRNDKKLFRIGGEAVGLLTEKARMRVLPGDEEHRAR